MQFLFLSFLPVLSISPDVQVERPAPKLLTSSAFHRTMSAKVTARWRNVPLRKMLDGIATNWKVGSLLDRRIDPTRKLTLSLMQTPLKDGMTQIAKAVSARAVIVGNVVYVGPTASVAALETVVPSRASEWRKAAKSWPRARRRALIARPTLHWNDLDRPREIVKNFAAKFGLTVDGVEKIPHDLWAGGTVPGCSVSQGLSLLLVQFDLTFRWKPDGSGIAIVPLPAAKK